MGASAEEIIETIKKCPSGALSYSIAGVEHRDQEREPAVTVTNDGALRDHRRNRAARRDLRRGRIERALHVVPLRRFEEQAVFATAPHWQAGFRDPAPAPREIGL